MPPTGPTDIGHNSLKFKYALTVLYQHPYLRLVHGHEGLLDNVSHGDISSLLDHRPEVVQHPASISEYYGLLSFDPQNRQHNAKLNTAIAFPLSVTTKKTRRTRVALRCISILVRA